MCESRVLPCPQGSAEWQKGETREEGGHALDMFALTNKLVNKIFKNFVHNLEK